MNKLKFKKLIGVFLASSMIFGVSSSMILDQDLNVLASTDLKYEFEDGAFDNCKSENWTVIDEGVSGNPCDISDWSGTGFGYIKEKGSSVTLTVNVEKEGLYELLVRYCEPFDARKKVQYLNINGVNQGEVSFPYCEKFEEMSAGYVKLKKGENTVQIKAYWGYTLLDYLVVKEADPSIINLNPTRQLVNENASDITKRLYNYLCDIYGKNILAGQQEYCGSHNYNYSDSELVDNESEFEYILETTGKQVAVRGFDFLFYNSSSTWDDRAAQRIAEWGSKVGGISTLCYHWAVPNDNGETKFYYKSDAYPDGTTFSIKKALQKGTDENKIIMADIKILAEKLQIVEDANVPILFRPLHEAEGAWFWWGAEGPEACKELYYLLYDQLTNVYGLDNLIWVWTGYTFPTSPAWYPGDEYVDIIGYDKYNAVDGLPNLSSISSTFYNLVASTGGKKMVTMSENDSIPSLENLLNDGAAWLWFCPWYNNYLTSQQINPKEELIKIYQSDYCITLDELPDFSTYPIKNEEPIETTTTSDKIIYGDLDNDLKVTLSDLVKLCQYMIKDIELTEKEILKSDVSGDGKIDIADVAVLKQYSLGDKVTLGPK